jgi:hypothetical protein
LSSLGGVLTKWEMILGLLDVVDDRQEGAFEEAVERVRCVRGSRAALDAAVDEVCERSQVTRNTLSNYTRLPVGVLKAPELGWGTSEYVSGIYERRTKALTLTDLGAAVGEAAASRVDVRESDLEVYSDDERANFANVGYYAMLGRAGLPLDDFEQDRAMAWEAAQRIVGDLGVASPEDLLYSPLQQAPDAILQLASELGN